MNIADKKFEVVGTTVYELEFDSWRKGVEQLRNRLYASVQGSRDTPKEELEAVAKLFAVAPEMFWLLDGAVNALANYRSLQKTNDPIGAQVTTAFIQEIKAVLIKVGAE